MIGWLRSAAARLVDSSRVRVPPDAVTPGTATRIVPWKPAATDCSSRLVGRLVGKNRPRRPDSSVCDVCPSVE
jgi:hypothetical protein